MLLNNKTRNHNVSYLLKNERKEREKKANERKEKKICEGWLHKKDIYMKRVNEVCVCVCVCAWERERGVRVREGKREKEHQTWILKNRASEHETGIAEREMRKREGDKFSLKLGC